MSQKSAIPKLTLAVLLALLLVGLATLAFAQDEPTAQDAPTGGTDFPLMAPPNINGDLDPASEPFFMIGDYCGGFGGVSLNAQTTGAFTVPLTGDLKTVYLLWSGRNKEMVGDDTISVSVNGGAAQLIQADTSLTADSDLGFDWFTYAYDASADGWPFLQGINDITVSGLTDGASATFEPHGVGMLLVGEDPAQCPFQAIGIYYGNDVLYHGWTGASGPNSEVTCLNVASPPDPVEMDIQMFVGGVENPRRSNAIWVETGSGAAPTDIVGNANAVELRMALKGLQGDEFDNYDTIVQDPRPIIVEPGETWACVQIESPPTPYADKEQGISATWINLTMRLPLAEIEIDPDGLNPVGVAHTFTVTVNSAFGFDSLVITPTVEPAPEVQTDTCDTPNIAGGIATCNVTINSSVAGVFTATAEAAVGVSPDGFGGMIAHISTDNSRESENGPAVKTYFEGPTPAIDLEKATNGEDADDPTGPLVEVGGTVTWTYRIENTGDMDLIDVTLVDDNGTPADPGDDYTCNVGALAVGAVDDTTCTRTGVAVEGQYANMATVEGTPVVNGQPQGDKVTDEDPSHYFGFTSTVDLEKATNGEDADDPTGPYIDVGDPVTWTYEVTNSGNVTLTEVTVVDDQGVDVSCPKDTLVPGESMVCTGTGVAVEGQYANQATVTGRDPTGKPVTDKDPSHYFGSSPAIDIEKATNGEDADEPTGPKVDIGGPVHWTYEVTNMGNVTLTGVTVTDDQGVAVTCPKDTLTPGESMTCTGEGIAMVGQYANMGDVVGTSPTGEQVTDEDPSHYFGGDPDAIDDPDIPGPDNDGVRVFLPLIEF